MSVKTPLFKLRLPDSQRNSYLFGTMHSRDERAFTFYDLAIKYLRKCDYFASEMDMTQINHDLHIQSFKLEDNNTLQNILGIKKFEKYTAIAEKSFSINLKEFNTFNPLFIHGLLTEQCLKSNRNLNLDQQLFQDALSFAKAVSGIESQQEQIDISKKISLETQLLMLKYTLKNVASFRQKIGNISDAYEEGNIHKILKLSNRKLLGLKNLLINQRNIIMSERIDVIAKSQSSFTAIGAAHLSGPFGVISLMQQKGWRFQNISR